MLSKHALDSCTTMPSAPRVIAAIVAAAIIARATVAVAILARLSFLALAALRLIRASLLEDELAVDSELELELELTADGLAAIVARLRSFSFIAALSRRSPS